MKKNKKKNRLDFSKMAELEHRPFAKLGEKFGVQANDNDLPEKDHSPSAPLKTQLLIRKERRKGQKWVTVVYHLDPEGLTFLKDLKKRFATGGGLDDGNLVLQGDHVQGLALWFQDRGYKTRTG